MRLIPLPQQRVLLFSFLKQPDTDLKLFLQVR
jgi:hypothetical protein